MDQDESSRNFSEPTFLTAHVSSTVKTQQDESPEGLHLICKMEGWEALVSKVLLSRDSLRAHTGSPVPVSVYAGDVQVPRKASRHQQTV